MNSLCLHTGGKSATVEEIRAVPVPAATMSWMPISHAELYFSVRERVEERGCAIIDEAHGLARRGNHYFGLLRTDIGRTDSAQGLVLGLRNSMDKSLSAGLVAGSQVFVCDNLAFSGEVKLGRKHTSNIRNDLISLIDKALDKMAGFWNRTLDLSDRYRSYELRNPAQFVIDCLDTGIISGSQIPKVLSVYRGSPKYGLLETGAIAPTVWRGFNSVTEVLAGNAPLLAERTPKLYNVCTAYCN